MKQLDLLLEAGLYSDALDYLQTHGNPDSNEYLFYLGFIQVHLGWTEEAIETLTKHELQVKDNEFEGTVSGLLADIFYNEGMLFDAVNEISKALKAEPDCPLIKKKANEIYDDFNGYFLGVVILLATLLSMKKVPPVLKKY